MLLPAQSCAEVLAELALELRLFSPQASTQTEASRAGEQVSLEAAEDLQSLSQLCALILLLSVSTVGPSARKGWVRLWDIVLLVEDVWLGSVPHNGARLSSLVADCRYAVMRCRAADPSRSLRSALRSVFRGSSSGGGGGGSGSSSSGRGLSAPDTTVLNASQFIDGVRRLSSMCGSKSALSAAEARQILQFCSWKDGVNDGSAGSFSVNTDSVIEWLCMPISSYREVQQRVQVYAKAIRGSTRYIADTLKQQVQSRNQETDTDFSAAGGAVSTGGTSSRGSRKPAVARETGSTSQTALVAADVFRAILTNSPLPLNAFEVLVLVRLVQGRTTPAENNSTGVTATAAAAAAAAASRGPVDPELWYRICRGDLLQASLS